MYEIFIVIAIRLLAEGQSHRFAKRAMRLPRRIRTISHTAPCNDNEKTKRQPNGLPFCFTINTFIYFLAATL
jgi:hypothetical protein